MRSNHYSIRTRLFSYSIERRAVYWTVVLTIALFALVCVSAGIGSLWISPLEVLRGAFGFGDDATRTVLYSFRLPRAAMSVLAGACLAASGALLQSVSRNALASPDMIGVTGGAAAAGVASLVLTGGAIGLTGLSLSAIGGAVAVAALLFALAWKGGVSPLRLVLIGVALQTAAGALSSFMIILSPTYLATQAFTWLTGSVYGSSWNNVVSLLPWAAGFGLVAWMLSRKANVHELGEDVAASVGSRVSRERSALIAISAALAGAAVSQVGAIGFIGLMAPHMARRLVGPAFGAVLPVSACIGAMLLLIADTLGRTAFPPNDIPAGVFTAAVGAPFFVYLLLRRKGK
ncbi:iron ABC transporter permease [Paenibacillus sp.]|uniref:FecCD family ABC transporter permease n=1 Tax=Paenibacillus sp. TaxID=58172 RepID=UPI0028122BA1|nr:iron ABC transporter permease [Paenibacillus sp.]